MPTSFQGRVLCVFVKQNEFASLVDAPDDFGINYFRCSLSSRKQNGKHKLLYQTVDAMLNIKVDNEKNGEITNYKIYPKSQTVNINININTKEKCVTVAFCRCKWK